MGKQCSLQCVFCTALQNGATYIYTYSMPEVVQYFVAHESILLYIKPAKSCGLTNIYSSVIRTRDNNIM